MSTHRSDRTGQSGASVTRRSTDSGRRPIPNARIGGYACPLRTQTDRIRTLRVEFSGLPRAQSRFRSTRHDWLGPAIYSTGPITDGDPPSWPVARIVTSPEQAQRAVADDKRNGYIAIKVYGNLSLGAYDAIVSAATTRGARFKSASFLIFRRTVNADENA